MKLAAVLFLTFAFVVIGLSRVRPQKRVQQGVWGATGVNVQVTAGGATITYDCGRGTIDVPLVLDRRGRFRAKGKHVQGHAGPVRNDEEGAGVAAVYTGTVAGDHMSLKVTLAASGQEVGTYELTFGQSGRLRRCY